MATYIYDYHEERGEFHAYVQDEMGNIVWEVHYPEYLEDDETGELLEGSTIFEDGYMKNADDLVGLYHTLREWGAIEEGDEVVKKEDYEKKESKKDDLLEFTIPMMMANAIVNDEDYFLTEEERESLYNFLQNLTNQYGNANLMMGDENDELGFCWRNDVNNLGGDCIRMYLRPSKSYEDGGVTNQGEYGYGTSLLAKGGSIEEKIKAKLSANFELPIEMAIYVPSTEKANQVISKRDYASRIDDVRSFLANLFGGYSSGSIDGGYYSEDKGLIQEDVTKVTAFAPKDNLENKLQSLIAQIREWCNAWGQESIGFEFEGDMFYVDKDAKFMSGGSIPPGFHQMPDGTIMADSAHMKEGGEVDEDEDKDENHLEYISGETGIPTEVLKEYANNKGIKISELDTDLGYQGSYDDESKFAEYVVDEGLMSDLSYYLEMYDTDKRIVADELTDSYMDGLDDDDLLERAGLEDEANESKELEEKLEEKQDEIESLKDERQDLIDSQEIEDMTESDREDLDKALEVFDGKIEDLESEISGIKYDIRNADDYDTVVERARDNVREEYYDDVVSSLEKDPVGYFTDELGYDVQDLVNKNGFYVDYDAVARDLENDYDFIEYGGEVYVFSSYYAWGGGIDLGKSFDKFKKMLNEETENVQSQLSDNDVVNMAMESVGDAWEDLTSNEQLGIIKGFREGYGKGQMMARGGKVDSTYTHFAVRKSDNKIVTGWEYKDLDKESIKYYTTMDLKDMDFKPSDFRILTTKYLKLRGIDPFDWSNWKKTKEMAHGGSVEEGNLMMLKNQAKEFKHHSEELGEVVNKNPRVDAWVVAKAERASSDLSDITHYLDGQENMMAHGGDVKSIIPNIDTSKKTLDEIDPQEREEVASKIDKLVEMVNEAKEKGEKPLYYNLCDISVPGTNIYCDDNLGIDRNDMPQFKGTARPNSLADQLPKDPKSSEVDTEEFFKLMLNKRGIEVDGGQDNEGIEVEPDLLKATQMNMVGDKVAGMYGALEKDPHNPALTAAIYVSNDGYVLDGHHRWAAIVTYNAKNPSNPIPMKVRVIDMPIKELVTLANDFADSIGIEKKAAVAGKFAKGGRLTNQEKLREEIYYLIHYMLVDKNFRVNDLEKVKEGISKYGNKEQKELAKKITTPSFGKNEQLGEVLFKLKYSLPKETMAKGGQVELGDWEFDEHGWAYNYGKLKAKTRSFGFMVSVDPNEKASVSWDEPYMQNATWDKKIIDEVRKDIPISKNMAKGGETKFINLKTLKGQSEVEKYLQKGWSVKYQGDKFAILQKGGKKMVKGGATFDDKVNAISKNLKGRKVPKKLQKDYGKTYDTKKERDDAARRIAGAMRADEMGTRKK